MKRGSVSFQEALKRSELETRESQLSFVAAALMGARDLAHAAEEKDLGRAINVLCIQTLGLRTATRRALRELDRGVASARAEAQGVGPSKGSSGSAEVTGGPRAIAR